MYQRGSKLLQKNLHKVHPS